MRGLLEKFEQFGLSGKEAEIYLALYRLGEATAYEVAKESGLKRPTVYVVMEELRKKGLALVIPHAKKQIFIAKDPHEFIAEEEARTASAAREIFTLLPKMIRDEANVKVFKGAGALAHGLSYGLHGARTKEILAFYAGVYPHTKITPEYTQHLARLGSMGFKMKSIIPSNSQDHIFRKQDAEFGFERKKIDSSIFSPSISIELFDNLVKLILHKSKELIVIDDKFVAEFFRQIFQALWVKA